MAYPTTIDDFTNPASGDPLNSPSHSTQHININNAVEALEAKVGADSSAVTTSHDYKIAQLESTRELTTNKETSALDTSTTKYPCNNVVKEAIDAKMSNPMTAKGDVIIGGDSGTPDKLAKGTDGQVLKLASGVPTWESEQDISGKLDKSNLTAKGTLISASGVSTPSTLLVGTNGQLLSSDSNETAGLKWIDAPSVPSKASYSDLNTGSDDSKYLTAKSVADSNYIKESDIRNSQSIVSNSSITPTGGYSQNEVYITALAVATTINAPSGTPVNGNTLLIRIKDNGTKRDLTWNAIYTWIGVDKPEETTASKVMYIGAIYNSTSEKWEVIALNQEE